MRWKTGRSPLDQPQCGFHGELCLTDSDFCEMVRETRQLTTHSFYPNVQVLGVVGPLVFVFVVVTGVADRNWRYYMIVTGDKV